MTTDPSATTPSASAAALPDDPAELRADLIRARERLTWYESFDKIIADNVRRTGEMMAETVAMREEAAAQRDRAALADEERARYQSTIATALADIATLRASLDAITARLEAVSSSDLAPATPAPATASDDADDEEDLPAPRVSDIAPLHQQEEGVQLVPEIVETIDAIIDAEPTTPDGDPILPDADPTPEPAEPQPIDVIAHGANLNIASGLQNILRTAYGASNVQLKEFVNGELRLVLTPATPVAVDDIATWTGDHNGTLTSHRGTVIELDFTP